MLRYLALYPSSDDSVAEMSSERLESYWNLDLPLKPEVNLLQLAKWFIKVVYSYSV